MRFFILSAALAAATITGTVSAAERLNAIVAIVNNQSISRLEIAHEEEELRQRAAASGNSPTSKEIQKEALDGLINRLLQLQQARLLGVQIPNHMLERRMDAVRAEFGVSDDEAFQQAVAERWDISLPEFRRRLSEDMAIEAVFVREVYEKTEIYEEEVDHFMLTESGFASEREYLLRHILLEGRFKKDNMTWLRHRIVSGKEPFEHVARDNSEGPAAENGGLLEWRTASELPEPFIPVAQNLHPGEISEVIETSRGFHLLKMEDIRGGDFSSTERLRLAHVFLTPEDKELAEQLYRRLVEGADFSGIVSEYSRDQRSVEKGGDLGWFLLGDLPDYFAPTKDLEVGGVSEPIESPFGIHLVRVNEKNDVDIEELRNRARDILRERRALVQQRDWLQQLRNRAYVIIVDPEFSGFNSGTN